MDKNCGCKNASKIIQYEYQCKEIYYNCSIIEFEKDQMLTPYCCGV